MKPRSQTIYCVGVVFALTGLLVFAACSAAGTYMPAAPAATFPPAPTSAPATQPPAATMPPATMVQVLNIAIPPEQLVFPAQASDIQQASVRQLFLVSQAALVNNMNDVAVNRNMQFASAVGGVSLNWAESKVAYRESAGQAVPEVIAVPVQSNDPSAYSPERLATLQAAGMLDRVVLGGLVLVNDVADMKSGTYTFEWNVLEDTVCITNPDTGVCEKPTYCISAPDVIGPSIDIYSGSFGVCVNFFKRRCCI